MLSYTKRKIHVHVFGFGNVLDIQKKKRKEERKDENKKPSEEVQRLIGRTI